DRPGSAPAGDDEAARRLELVPAELARLAPEARARRADPARGAGSRGRVDQLITRNAKTRALGPGLSASTGPPSSRRHAAASAPSARRGPPTRTGSPGR